MKVFVTGATGFVGSAVVHELLQNGHQVIGLARNEKAATKLTQIGATTILGDLENIESLKNGATTADAIIHTGFIHDFTRFQEVGLIDCRAITTMGSAIEGTDKPFIITSASDLIQSDKPVVENDKPLAFNNPRMSEEAADLLTLKGVRMGIVRLPTTVHGDGDHGFILSLIDIAREKGVSAFIGDGNNLWPAVNRLDAAKLFRLAIEHPFAAGARFHAVAESGIPFKNIADSIAAKLSISTTSLGEEDAGIHFGWLKQFVESNNRVSSDYTQQFLDWTPTNKDLLGDIETGTYFNI